LFTPIVESTYLHIMHVAYTGCSEENIYLTYRTDYL